MNDLGHKLPIWSVGFFVLLLLAIAVLPLAWGRFWDRNRNKAIVAVLLSLPVPVLLLHCGDLRPLWHEVGEYVSFIVLLGSLFVVAGGIHLSGDILATPRNNTLFLAVGGVIANVFGTTGAAMLLIRPLLRTNDERAHVAHIPVFFIFVVCNIGGCLLPIGDPPLFMGFLRGVPFFWTLRLLPQWLFMMAAVLGAFYFLDRHHYRKERPRALAEDLRHYEPIRLHGALNLVLIGGVLASVIFLGSPWREIAMVALGLLSLVLTPKEIHEKNDFNFAPIGEVAVLFAGIFVTMVPALLILEARGSEVGVRLPWHFFWVAGGLSSFLDNTPTYLTYLSLARGLTVAEGLPAEVAGVPAEILKAISLGAVFMGANTYIGNGPNFMVKVICEHQKVKVPSFFGYMVWSGLVLIPLFVLFTIVFFS
ncbi:MAG: sodium:proton antiporter [Deltaproteobacteria bacterium]|nr:sodium:proton antiporter [Deltaproteobacteria bacterium]